MANTTSTSAANSAPKNLLARFIGIITSPRDTFQSVVAHPRWFGMLALICLTMAVLLGGFLFTKVGQDAWLDAATASPFSGQVSDQQYQAMQRMAAFAGYLAVAQALIFTPIFFLIVSGILFAVFNAAMGGSATFKQQFAVVVHTGVIGVLALLFMTPLNYARGTMTSATNLGVLLPMLEENSFLSRFLGTIDLFWAWQTFVLSIGLGVLYRRRTQPIAMWLFIIYAVIAAIIAVVMTRLRSA